MVSAAAFSQEDFDEKWYEKYQTEDGTKLTRDFTFGLNSDFNAVPNNSVFEDFEFLRSELPEELPVFAPYQAWEIDSSKAKIFVAPNGRDSNPGTIDKPLLTAKSAIDRLTMLKNRQGGVTVYFREGVYSIPDGLEIPAQAGGNNNNPVFISSYNNEKVTFTGGIAIHGSEMKPVNDAVGLKKLQTLAKPHIYSVDLKKLGYNQFGEFSQSLRPVLYVDGIKYTIARWPNADNTSMAEYKGADAKLGVVNAGDIIMSGGTEVGEYTGTRGEGMEFQVVDSRPFSWEKTDNIWM